jgi:hypothetical protein
MALLSVSLSHPQNFPNHHVAADDKVGLKQKGVVGYLQSPDLCTQLHEHLLNGSKTNGGAREAQSAYGDHFPFKKPVQKLAILLSR